MRREVGLASSAPIFWLLSNLIQSFGGTEKRGDEEATSDYSPPFPQFPEPEVTVNLPSSASSRFCLWQD